MLNPWNAKCSLLCTRCVKTMTNTIDKLKSHWVPNTHEDTHARTPKAFICIHSRKTWMIWSSQLLFGDPCTSRKKRNLSNLQPQPLSTRLYCWCFFGSACWWLGAVAMNHSTIHVLFAIETMAITIWRHLFLCHYQPLITHTEAHSHTHTLRYKTNGIEKVWHCWK